MKNLWYFRERPQHPLGPITDRWNRLIYDENRMYCKKLTHLYSWEIQALYVLCAEGISKPRGTSWRKPRTQRSRKGRPCKASDLNRLVYVLEWLSSGDFGNKMEFEMNWSKTSLTEDRYHILKVICEVLKDEIK